MDYKRLARIMLIAFLLTFGLLWLALEMFPSDQALIQRCLDHAPPPTPCWGAREPLHWTFQSFTSDSPDSSPTKRMATFSDGANDYYCRVEFAGFYWKVIPRGATLVGCLSP